MRLAILITCHNRKDKTLQCLQALFAQQGQEVDYNIEVFLVDDGSTDGTAEAVKIKFPSVNIIQGNGNLYWNRGMLLAWQTAAATADFDYYLWLNDDTNLDNDALAHIFSCYNESLLFNEKPKIIVGACRENVISNNFSYGVRDDYGPIIPNGNFQYGKYINGNCVLVSAKIVDSLGILSEDYTHAIGDTDYGLRALKVGFQIITTKKYIAVCTRNNIPIWCNSKKSLLERWRSLHSPLGLNIKEYKLFRYKYWPERYYIDVIKVYLKVLMPSIYNYFKKVYKSINLALICFF